MGVDTPFVPHNQQEYPLLERYRSYDALLGYQRRLEAKGVTGRELHLRTLARITGVPRKVFEDLENYQAAFIIECIYNTLHKAEYQPSQ